MALYNNYPYQPMYYPQYQQPQQSNTGVIWVQGEAGAKSYLVAPNTTVALWDSEAQVIYLKSADASGMPTIKTLDYTVRDLPKDTKTPEYVTKQDFEYLREQVMELRMKAGEGKA